MKYNMNQVGILFMGLLIFLVVCTHFLNGFTQNKYYVNLGINKGMPVILNNIPQMYSRSSHVTTKVNIESGNYHIRYGFKDHKNVSRVWEAKFPKEITDHMIYKFGVPNNFFKPYYARDDIIAKRKKQMEDGMWYQNGNYVIPDLNAIATYYKGFTKPIASFIDKSLGSQKTWKDRIEFTLKFCQDIPYGIPPNSFNNKKIGGIFTPPQSLLNLYADCDSKAVLFASTMSHFSGYDMIYVHVPGHVLLAIKGNPGPYDYYFTYKNQKYLYTESVGPERFAFGRSSSRYRSVQSIIPVQVGDSYPDINAFVILNDNTNKENVNTNNDWGGNFQDDNNTISEINDEDEAQIIFWTDNGTEGKISIYINNKLIGVISSYSQKSPSCEGTLGVRTKRKPGNYTFRAESKSGSEWRGDIEIQDNTCHLFRL